MAVFEHVFHNNVIAYMFQFGESPIHRSFAAWLIFVKVTFSCLNLKPYDGFLHQHA